MGGIASACVMRYSTHYYNERGEFSFFRLDFATQADAEQDACDELALPTRAGYHAHVQKRPHIWAPAVIVSYINCKGEITYV